MIIYDWTITDQEYATKYNGISGTMFISASGFFEGGKKSRIFSTIDGPQIDEGEAPEVIISKCVLKFVPDIGAEQIVKPEQLEKAERR